MSPPPRVTRYLTVKLPGHPLATTKRQVVYVHRVVLYDTIGPGVHLCTWCKRELEWNARGLRCLVVDHLDGDTWNNKPENLVPACRTCNCLRGKRADFLTHCGSGHELTPENVYIRPDGQGKQCRLCNAVRGSKRPTRPYKRRRPLKGLAAGERLPFAKLTEAAVRDIRLGRADGQRIVDLATKHRVSPASVSDVLHGRTWTHVA